MRGNVPKVHYGIFVRSQWYGKHQKVCTERMLCLVISCVTREILKIIQKNLNIIEEYETAKERFTAEYILIREKVTENTVSELFTATRDDIQNKRRQVKDEFRNLSDVVKDVW